MGMAASSAGPSPQDSADRVAHKQNRALTQKANARSYCSLPHPLPITPSNPSEDWD